MMREIQWYHQSTKQQETPVCVCGHHVTLNQPPLRSSLIMNHNPMQEFLRLASMPKRRSLCSPPPISNGVELDTAPPNTDKSRTHCNRHIYSLNATGIDPWLKIPTLRDIKVFEFVAAFHHSFDPNTSNSHTASDAQRFHFEKMNTN